MPGLNEGFLQGSILPFYLGVRTWEGVSVPQPTGYPTIEIGYIEPTTHIRRIPIRRLSMSPVQDGVWSYLWHIPKDEPATEHVIIMRAVLEGEVRDASDDTFLVTHQVENPDFEIRIDVLTNEGIFYPEVMDGGPKVRTREVTYAYMREEDIGLNDFALEGDFRFRDYPNRIVDRRAAGRFVLTGYVGHHITSETPGGGTQRMNDPNTGVAYDTRQRYRYT